VHVVLTPKIILKIILVGVVGGGEFLNSFDLKKIKYDFFDTYKNDFFGWKKMVLI